MDVWNLCTVNWNGGLSEKPLNGSISDWIIVETNCGVNQVMIKTLGV